MITQSIATSYKSELLSGVHTSTDTYKIALYTSAATLGASTTAYSATNEVVGTGYTAGGNTLVGFSVTTIGTEAILDFTTDPVWSTATITARGALIYNSSKSNKAVAVFDFGSDITSTNGDFTTSINANGAIRIN